MNRRPLARKATLSIKSLRDFDWDAFKDSVYRRYSKSYAPTIMHYCKKYGHLLETGNLGELELVPATSRNNCIKGLIVLAKFLGVHEEFKSGLKSYGIKLSRPDAFSAFTRIYTNNNSNLDEWLAQVKPILRAEENLALTFLRANGLRMSEGLTSFNMVISLSQEGRLSEYLNSEDGILEHFRYRKLFLRGTKNAFISIIPESLINEIKKSKPVTYNGIIKRLQRRHLPCRIGELRDFYGTFMVKHGLVVQEVDLLCGRIPPSIFVRHYFSPAIKELRDRTLKALEAMEKTNV